MKLRMRGNTVRLRLTRNEVERLTQIGVVEERVPFPSETLVYRLQLVYESGVTADLNGPVIVIGVPRSQAETWASTAQVSLTATAGSLSILIEKDFQCTHGPADAEAYDPASLVNG